MTRPSSPDRWIAALTDSRLQRLVAWSTVLCLAFSPATVPELWAAEWFVDADTGSDGNTGTTAADPWQTITRAITEATLAPGDVIHVDEGLYDAANGESFPLSLIDGVEIAGDGAMATTIVADDGAPAFSSSSDLGPGTELHGFTIRHDTEAGGAPLLFFSMISNAMEPAIHDNAFVGVGSSLPVGIGIGDAGTGTRSFTGTIENNSFSNLDVGVQVWASSSGTANYSPVIRGNTMTDLSFGVNFSINSSIAGTFAPLIEGNTIAVHPGTTSSSAVGIVMSFFLSSSAGDVTVAPTVRGNTLTGFEGVWLSGSGAQDGLLRVDALFENNMISTDEHGFDLSLYGGSAGSGTVVDWDVTVRNNSVTVADDAHGLVQILSSLAAGDWAVDTVIAGNTVTTPFDDGIELSMTWLSGAASVDATTTIVGNDTFGGDAGVAIELAPTIAAGSSIDVRVLGNTVAGDQNGIVAAVWSEGSGDVSVLVEGNTVTDAINGMQIVATSSTTNPASFELRDNLVRDNLDFGMLFALEDSYDGLPLVTCNTVTANGNGAFTGSSPERVTLGADDAAAKTAARSRGASWSRHATKGLMPPPPDDAGIGIAPLAGAPDLGGGAAGSPGLNSIFGNTTTTPPPWDVLNAVSTGVAAEDNWWGSVDTATIDGHILDEDENPFSGPVDFVPFLMAAPTVAPGASLALSAATTATTGGTADTARFEATLEGGGDCGCANPRFAADVPAGATVTAVSLSQGVVTDAVGDDGTLDGALGTLGPAESVTLVYEMIPAAGSCAVASQVRLTCDNVTGVVATATQELTLSMPDLAIAKTDGLDFAQAGDPHVYTITVENLDATCPASGASVADTFPAAFLSPTWDCVAGATSACGSAMGSGDLAETVDVAAGETVVFTVSGTLDPAFVGSLENTATVDHPDDPNAANDEATDTTFVTAAATPANVFASKSVTGDFVPGGAITYTIELANDGGLDQPDDPASDEFVDVVPATLVGVTAADDSPTGTTTVTPNPDGTTTVRYNGPIPSGAIVTITIMATIAADAGGETIVNQGTVHYDASGDGVNDSMRTTDDPAQPGGDDPTAFVVAGSAATPLEIPTLGEWGILLLALLLALGGCLRLRRRSRPFATS